MFHYFAFLICPFSLHQIFYLNFCLLLVYFLLGDDHFKEGDSLAIKNVAYNKRSAQHDYTEINASYQSKTTGGFSSLSIGGAMSEWLEGLVKIHETPDKDKYYLHIEHIQVLPPNIHMGAFPS
jgi:hypothetical protein